MARGDVVSSQASVATAAAFTHQPAAGVEVLVRSIQFGLNTATATDTFELGVTDGTTPTRNASVNPGSTTRMGVSTPFVSILINNTRYLHLQNASGGTLNISFTGLQTK